MRLNFKTKFPWGNHTWFKEKILKKPGFEPKIHTIRRDPKRRWKPGRKIDMCTGSRYKPVVFNSEECKSIQHIVIEWDEIRITPDIYIDGRLLTIQECLTLSRNDGFDSIVDFCRWFSETETDTIIIHWTDFKY